MGMGGRIRKLRTERGLSQEALAEALGISRQAVAKWEGEQSAPSAGNLTAMAELFGVPVTAITAPEPEEAPGEVPAAAEPASGKGGGLWKALLGLGAALTLLGAIAVWGFWRAEREAASLGIIGGADGPTQIYVTGPELPLWLWGVLGLGLLLLLAGAAGLWRRRKAG